MKHGGKIAVGLVGGLMLGHAALGITADSSNPYGRIAKRNAFALRSSTCGVPIDPPQPPPQKITLLGIVSFGRTEVIFKTMTITKPGEAPKEISFSAGIGERQGEIEVLDIDPVAGTVKVKNHGVEQLLTLENDGLKPAGSPAPTGLPGVRGAVRGYHSLIP